MGRGRWLGVLLAASGPSLAALAQVSPKNVELERAGGQVEAGDFEDAVVTLERGLSKPDLPDDQLVELYRLLGLAHLYLGDEEQARDAFEKLLQARPDFELPRSTPPKVRAIYARLKEDLKKRRLKPVTLSFDAPASLALNQPWALSVHVENLALGSKPRLFFRKAGGERYSSADFARKVGSREDFSATVPALESAGAAFDLEYYVDISDGAARRLAGRGDAFAPLRVPVVSKDAAIAASAESHWYQNPWTWIGIGLGVAGITTGAIVLGTMHPTSTLDVTIRVEP